MKPEMKISSEVLVLTNGFGFSLEMCLVGGVGLGLWFFLNAFQHSSQLVRFHTYIKPRLF